MFCQDIIPASASTFPLNYVFLFSPQLLAVFFPPWFNKYNICFNKGEVYGYFKYIIWRPAHFSLCQATRHRNPEQKYSLPGHGQPDQKPSGEIQWFQEPRLSWALPCRHPPDWTSRSPESLSLLRLRLLQKIWINNYRIRDSGNITGHLLPIHLQQKKEHLRIIWSKMPEQTLPVSVLRRKTDQKLHGCIMIQFLLRTGCLPHLLLSTELSWKSIWIPAAIIRSVYTRICRLSDCWRYQI